MWINVTVTVIYLCTSVLLLHDAMHCVEGIWSFPGWLLSPDGVFPGKTFPGKSFPGWSFSRMRRFLERLREWYYGRPNV